jgi:hypothetical protein
MARPKKYTTEAERKAAISAKNKRYKQKKKHEKELRDAAIQAPELEGSAKPTPTDLGIRAEGLEIPSGLDNNLIIQDYIKLLLTYAFRTTGGGVRIHIATYI